MKKIPLLLVALFFVLGVAAQKETKKYDIILKTNGDELAGEVKEVGPDLIKFIYKNEKLVYEIKKTEIFRITYASGRSEIFTKPGEAAPEKPKPDSPEPTPVQPTAPATASAPSSTAEDRRNKVAVLPFTFLRDNQSMGDDMAYQVQEEVYAYLKKHSSTYSIVDPATTNARLIKAGVTRDKMKGYTMDEICNIIGVEYIVEGTIKQNKGTSTSYSSDNYKSKSDGDKDKKVSGTSYSSTSQPYSSNVTLNVFNDKGENKYSQNRTGLIASDTGAYDSPLDYLLKRLPFYSK